MYRRRTFLGQFRRSGFLGVFRRTMVVGIFRRTMVVGIYRRIFVHRNIPANIGSSDPNPDPDIRRILQFLEGYPTPGYPRTPDPDKDNKIMDPPDKDPDPDTLKLPGYPIRLDT
ncbi:hypothetical protein F2Q69_00004106 [Brassica cretica]|uniref:Uncharacterized protein n=1 Tax=Brassica cretica TaxID=69181 RepID=A0A8S9PJ94_BRACR|nr:hypothetical protein F2Q69_00004106 [Brassica cretica]